MFYENNRIKIHPEYDQDSHGYFGRADAYMANNYIEGAGDASNTNNDGEAIDTECPTGTFNYGAVSKATSTNLTVSPVIPLVNPLVEYGNLSIAITEGTGLGQLEEVAAIDTNNNVITLSQPFDVIPNNTSRFTLYSPLAHFTVYSNTCANCAKGVWPFGAQYDCVVANNTTVGCNGIFVFSARSGPPASTAASDAPDYFTRIARNTVIGISRRSNQGGIGTYTGRFDSPNFYDVESYATEIIDNTVSGNNTIAPGDGTEAPPYDGLYVSSYPYSTMSNGSGTGDATDTLIQSNSLSNLPTGVTLTKCNYGQWVGANTYDASVSSFMNDYEGSTNNTIIASNILNTVSEPAVIISQPQSQSVTAGDTATFAVLAEGVSMPYYQWFQNNVAIPGATGASFTTSPTSLNESGTVFSVTVSNLTGTVSSIDALLTVSTTQLTPPTGMHIMLP